ncbi:MAG: SUMF1/EgtB/PvdO family nonheme iron enzyme [Hyphomicrobiaceae bacterium]|nr:SUMF1/EgtB/PvdO family nonheme iron enzyme [Hyphomicrobiaceae bacterium]
MADVFISYKSERRPAAQHLASIIEAHGFSVWFDYALVPGKNFGRHIETELRAAKATVVLWCNLSRESNWVHEEASLAKELGTFVPARVEVCDPPLGFRLDDYVDISGWDGDPRASNLDRLIDRIETLVGREAVIGRRRLLELHTNWTTLGRPRLDQFAKVQPRQIPDEDRRLPSSGAGPAVAVSVATSSHDAAERDWRAHDLDACTDPGLLRAYEAKWKSADPLWAYKAGQKAAGLEAARDTAQRLARAEGQWTGEGRVRIDAPLIHGAPKDADGAGWLLPGAGRTEWFRDHPDGPEMVVVPAGGFMMGSPDDEPGRFADEGPRHRVSIAKPFAVGRCAVTVDEYAAFVIATGHKMPDEIRTYEDGKWESRKGRSWRNPGFAQTGRHPVVGVSWDDAKAYAKWLSEATGKAYRLLSEAEWEYACRAGTDTPFWWGKAITPSQANYDGNDTYDGGGSEGVYRKATLPADYTGESFEPNPWGLHQMHGNVWEWCEDAWHESYEGAPADGTAWTKDGAASRAVLRGGSWIGYPRNLRSAQRNHLTSGDRYLYLGFRLGCLVVSPRTL